MARISAAGRVVALLAVMWLVGCRSPVKPTEEPVAIPPTATTQVMPVLSPTVVVSTATPSLDDARGGATATSQRPSVPGISSTTPVAPALGSALSPSAAAQAAQDGDYDSAISLWSTVLNGADESMRGEATLSLGRVYIAAERYHEAISLLVPYVEQAQDKVPLSQALGLLGVSYEALGEWRAAIAAYGQFLSSSDVEVPHVRLHIADAHVALDETEQAVAQLDMIDLASLGASRRAEVLQLGADLQRQLGEYDAALASYGAILDFSSYASYRALIGYRVAETLSEAGRAEEAVQHHSRVISEYPESYAARLALSALDEMDAGKAVDDLARGEVLYYAGEHADALEVLDRYLLDNTDGDIAHARYLGGRAAHAMDLYPRAFRDYDVVMSEYPGAPDFADAWLYKARASGAYGGDPISLYREFWRLYPDHSRAPDALWLAAQTLEDQGEWSRAAEFYGLLRVHYPEQENAADAAFREGLCGYLVGDYGGALLLWRARLDETTDQEDRARLLVWLGSASVQRGDVDAAQIYWRHSAREAPQSYYGLRATDLLVGGQEIAPIEPLLFEPSAGTSDADWETLRAWVASWYAPGSQIDMGSHVQVRQATALQGLGWHEAASEALRSVRSEVWDDPAGLLSLAQVCESRGVASLAISCAERLRHLAQEAGAEAPPRALWVLAYPTPYLHLVEAEAETYAVDPLLFLALMRQESRFDPRAISYAGASGLTQVMPETGEWIAMRLGDEDYDKADLHRPMVSIHYGMWFMGQLLDMNRRDWVAALVAYNAGPGNLRKWTNDEPISDHDLFYELLPVQQAQDYVWLIYEQYRMYQALYAQR